MLNDWQNRGVLLWSTFTTAVTVATSTTTYALDSSVNDALFVTYKETSPAVETKLERISFENIMSYLIKTKKVDQHNML